MLGGPGVERHLVRDGACHIDGRHDVIGGPSTHGRGEGGVRLREQTPCHCARLVGRYPERLLESHAIVTADVLGRRREEQPEPGVRDDRGDRLVELLAAAGRLVSNGSSDGAIWCRHRRDVAGTPFDLVALAAREGLDGPHPRDDQAATESLSRRGHDLLSGTAVEEGPD